MFTDGAESLVSARGLWDFSKAKKRYELLKAVGLDHCRTLTVRKFKDLPPEVKVDLNYLAARAGHAH